MHERETVCVCTGGIIKLMKSVMYKKKPIIYGKSIRRKVEAIENGIRLH